MCTYDVDLQSVADKMVGEISLKVREKVSEFFFKFLVGTLSLHSDNTETVMFRLALTLFLLHLSDCLVLRCFKVLSVHICSSGLLHSSLKQYWAPGGVSNLVDKNLINLTSIRCCPHVADPVR